MRAMIVLARKCLHYVIEIFILPYALFEIKRLNRDCGLNDLVDFAFRGCYGVITPAQVESEILQLLKILSETNPKFILEIGTASGGTLFLFSRVASEDATIISVDLPGGPFGRGYPKWRIPLYKSFALPKQQIHLIRANSRDRGTLEQVKAILEGEQIDFLFIDGDHSYYGVTRDFGMYGPLVRKRGIIVFHDIVPGLRENVGGVPEFWREIKDNYDSREIVKDWNQNGYGIGVLYL